VAGDPAAFDGTYTRNIAYIMTSLERVALLETAPVLSKRAPYESRIWIAKHARAWVRASPDCFLDHDERPGDDPENYRWELPLVGDLCLLKPPAEPRPKPGLLYDEMGRRRRVILVASAACPDPENSR